MTTVPETLMTASPPMGHEGALDSPWEARADEVHDVGLCVADGGPKGARGGRASTGVEHGR